MYLYFLYLERVVIFYRSGVFLKTNLRVGEDVQYKLVESLCITKYLNESVFMFKILLKF